VPFRLFDPRLSSPMSSRANTETCSEVLQDLRNAHCRMRCTVDRKRQTAPREDRGPASPLAVSPDALSTIATPDGLSRLLDSKAILPYNRSPCGDIL